MNRKHASIGLIASAMLLSSTAIFAADNTATTSLEAGVATTATPESTSTTAPATVIAEPAAAPAQAPAPAPKVDSTKKPLAKVTCEDFLAFDEVIQPKYVIAAEPYAKNGKPKNVVIDVVATETLVPVLIEECTKTPKESFLAKLKSKLKH